MRVHARALDRCASMNIVISRRQRVGSQSIGKYRGARFNMGQEKGSQGVGLSIGNDLNAAATEPFWMKLFHGHRNEHLASRPSSALSWARATNHRFIHFHVTAKPCVFRMSDGATKSVQHRPSGLVGPKPHKAVERFSRNPVLRCRHVPSRSEPYGEWCFRVMENRARRCRNSSTACFTPPPAIFHAPPRVARTFWTGKTGRPAQPVQVIEASSIVRKPSEEFGVVPGVIHTRLRSGLQFGLRHPRRLTSPHLSGYPVS